MKITANSLIEANQKFLDEHYPDENFQAEDADVIEIKDDGNYTYYDIQYLGDNEYEYTKIFPRC